MRPLLPLLAMLACSSTSTSFAPPPRSLTILPCTSTPLTSHPSPLLPRGGGSPPPPPSLLSRYESLLSSSPLLTKSITAGFITAFGDVLSQLLEAHLAPSKIPFSLVRLGAFLLAGTFFIGPFMTYWFEVLWSIGRRLPKSWSKRSVTLTQVLVDQTAGVALFFPAFFFCYELCESLASGRPRFPTLAGGKIRNDLPAILVNQYGSRALGSTRHPPTNSTCSLRSQVQAVAARQLRVLLVRAGQVPRSLLERYGRVLEHLPVRGGRRGLITEKLRTCLKNLSSRRASEPPQVCAAAPAPVTFRRLTLGLSRMLPPA